jgi:hypothetical protein
MLLIRRFTPPAILSILLCPLWCGPGLNDDAKLRMDSYSALGIQNLQQQNWRAAQREFHAGALLAESTQNWVRALRFLNAAGGAAFKANSYRSALNFYVKARSLKAHFSNAELVNSPAVREALFALHLNLASLYLVSADADAAALDLAEAKKYDWEKNPARPRLLALEARLLRPNQPLHGQQNQLSAVLEAAEVYSDWHLQAASLQSLGNLHFRQGDLPLAESCALQSFRIRVLHRLDGRELPLRLLSRIERTRHNLPLAEQYARLAISAAARQMPGSESRALCQLRFAQIRLAAGDASAALAALRKADEELCRWRGAVLPALSALEDSDVRSPEFYEDYVHLAAREGFREESLLVLERHRAASLLQLSTRTGDNFPESERYVQIVAELRRLEMQGALDPGARQRILRLRKDLTELEARAFPGLDLDSTPPHLAASRLRRLQRVLPSQSVAISFSLGQQQSWRWALSRSGVHLASLPSEPVLRRQIADLLKAVDQQSAPNAASARLGALLFSNLPAEALVAKHWYLSLDGALFELPIAALRLPAEDDFLVRRRSVLILPSFMFLAARASHWRPGPLLAIADPIYNRADPRYRRSSPPPSGFSLSRAWAASGHPAISSQEWPRLAGSVPESRSIATLWRSTAPVEILTGSDAVAATVADRLGRAPAVVHIAAHIESRETLNQPDSRILLSLTPSGVPDQLRASSLHRLRLPGSLVVMNGCSSGRGPVMPGLGLAGLARAWMVGGAGAVVGSLWPTPDNALLFESFYRHLLAGEPPARALQLAQLAAIDSGSWQAHPSHWAAWTISGRK